MDPRPTLSASFLAALLLLLVVVTGAGAETPLRQPGKTSLYERLLTRPGARLVKDPRTDRQNGKLIDAFSRFYVYERRRVGSQTWLRIGTDTQGRLAGWVAEERTVPWKQQLTLALTNPGAVRERLVFFAGKRDLEKVLQASNPGETARSLIRRLEGGGRDKGVVALEPETFVDINEEFYLLPVLEHQPALAATGEPVRLLKIASVTADNPETGPPAPRSRPRGEGSQDYKAAVVFVIDSTLSMGPYIDETKDAVTQVYKRLRDANVLDRVRFGLVAFRAQTRDDRRNRQLGYVAYRYVDPSNVRDAHTFLEQVKDLREAEVSTQFFDEDAFAGVVMALDSIRWEAFDARYIVLITDAGALDGRFHQDKVSGQPVESTTGLDAQRIASIAGEKQVAITVFHLKTPAGASNHLRAESQYRMLASNSRFQTEAYLPIDGGSPRGFRRAVDALTGAILANVADTGAGRPPIRLTSPGSQGGTAETTEQNVRAIANALGHAMRLRYLGGIANTRAPTLFEAWISDRDFADPRKQTIEVRVLLTQNQLSDLHMILKKIVHAAEKGRIKPDRFFDSLRSLAAQFGRDPNLAKSRKATRLADLGLLGEYLEDLPYQSQVMGLTQDTWVGWGPEKQIEFVNTLKRKLRQYDRYSADWENWIDIAQTADGSGDDVYPVPLQDMP